MNPKKQIMAFLNTPQCRHPGGETCEACDRIEYIRDGMSQGTATLVIDQAMEKTDAEQYSIKSLENKGRYYSASIVNHSGQVMQRLLVDKQSGEVHFI